jgi:hypothetical protein
MTRANPPAPSIERLANDLLERGPGDPMAVELAGWLAGSARFRIFAEAHRSKIRKKLRHATDSEAMRDVRAELLAARLLVADRRMELAFEAHGSGRGGPDFTVTFRGGRSFDLEVTRLRRAPEPAAAGGPLLAKLRQLPPSSPNALLIAVEGEAAEALDVAAATRALRSRADKKDEGYFIARGFDGTRGFYDRYLRLSAVFVWSDGAIGDARATLWTNRSSRIAMPPDAAGVCLACLRADA